MLTSQVDTPGRYDVAAMYYSRTDALGKGDGQQLNFTFKVSVGTFQQIKADSVPSVKAVLPQTVSLAGACLKRVDYRGQQKLSSYAKYQQAMNLMHEQLPAACWCGAVVRLLYVHCNTNIFK